jgi:hypothetical protein
MEATKDGVYYRNWMGRLYLLNGAEMTLVREASSSATRTIVISQTIPAADIEAGYPAQVSGSLKFDQGFEKARLSIQLASDGRRQPSPADQARFAEAAADGTERLKAITLNFHDADGFVAGAPITIPLGEGNWSRTVDEKGLSSRVTWSVKQPADADAAKSASTIEVEWSVPRGFTPPVPSTPPSVAPPSPTDAPTAPPT